MIKKIIFTLLAVLILGIGYIFAVNGKDTYDASKFKLSATDGLRVGSKIDFTLPNQFDKPISLSDDTKKVIFVFAKSTGHTVKEYLNGQNRDYLDKHKAMFVADISPMPIIIRNAFALPDLKKSPYNVLLIYDKNHAKILKDNQNSDKITIATLKNREIISIKYISTSQELKKEL